MRRALAAVAFAAVLAAGPGAGPARSASVTVGSKAFAESWILGDALSRLASRAGDRAEHRRNLGGTEIAYQALASGAVDIYPEYTGTVAEVILKRPGASLEEMRDALRPRGIGISEPLGFNDGYALAVRDTTAARLHLRTLSDLAARPEARLGLTHEFLGRADGFPGLNRLYGFRSSHVSGLQHELAYEALADGRIDATDIYTTDAQIARLHLVTLEDDRHFFPRYDAVLLYRLDLPRRAPAAWGAMRTLLGRVDEARMIRANGRVSLEHWESVRAADSLLGECLGPAPERTGPGGGGMWASILSNAARHLELVGFALLGAILAGIPLGILATRSKALAGIALGLSGVLQTIPSLALLALLIPLLGIGVAPALAALFLYGLLPIVRNTYVGLTGIPAPLVESAEALGLTGRTRLFRVYLPMASPAILAGIKTSAVINVGTATLAALIGAGGLGEPILSGIQLRDRGLILQGAVPAAVLALAVQWAFDLLEDRLVPRGLRSSDADPV